MVKCCLNCFHSSNSQVMIIPGSHSGKSIGIVSKINCILFDELVNELDCCDLWNGGFRDGKD